VYVCAKGRWLVVTGSVLCVPRQRCHDNGTISILMSVTVLALLIAVKIYWNPLKTCFNKNIKTLYSGLVFMRLVFLCCFCQALIDLKMFEKADDNFKRAIELEPDNGNIYVHRGFVLITKRFYQLCFVN